MLQGWDKGRIKGAAPFRRHLCTFNPSTWEGGREISEFKVSLDYRVSSRQPELHRENQKPKPNQNQPTNPLPTLPQKTSYVL